MHPTDLKFGHFGGLSFDTRANICMAGKHKWNELELHPCPLFFFRN
jgi:hypothetical protein